MEEPAQVLSMAVAQEKCQIRPPQSEGLDDLKAVPTKHEAHRTTRQKLWNRTTLSFFLMGILVGLPTMPITTAASLMFDGITGVYGICLSVTAAVSAFAGPMVARHVPYDICNAILTLASALAYVISTLPQPLANSTGANKAGPVIGTMLAGFVYAFGTQNYLAVAAFFPAEAVIALSMGSGLSIILGAGIFIGLMSGAFDQDWRRCFLVFLPTTVLMPVIWWFLFDKSRRDAAEASRRRSLKKAPNDWSSESFQSLGPKAVVAGVTVEADASDNSEQNGAAVRRQTRPGFSPNRTRTGMLFKTILPKYVLPLIICTTSAIFALFGLAPSLQTLNRLKGAPDGDLEYQLVFFAYGSAQFLFSALVVVQPFPIIWAWTCIELVLTAIVLVQLWYPFLTYFWVWFVIMFMVGGCVGGSVTNTNYKIAEDFQKAGEPDEVRSFANSYAGLGNFGGDALGGAIGLAVELCVVRGLKPTP